MDPLTLFFCPSTFLNQIVFTQSDPQCIASHVPYVHFVRDAAYVFAHALHDLHTKVCGAIPGVCPGMREAAYANLTQYMNRVSFKDVAGFDFSFTEKSQDGPPRYSIISYSPGSGGHYKWKEVDSGSFFCK